MSCHLCFAKCLRKLYVWNCMKFSMKCSLTKQAETEANDKSYFARDISLAFFYLLWKGFVSIRAQVIENKHIYIYIYIYIYNLEDLSSRHTVIRLFRSLDFGFTILSFRLRCFESSSEVRGLRGVRCFRPSSDAERFLSRIEFASASCCCLS